jgi:hypothetical protein
VFSRAVLIGRGLDLIRVIFKRYAALRVRETALCWSALKTAYVTYADCESRRMCSVIMAEGVHPIPFRTRQLSPPAPMVLRRRPWESRTSLNTSGGSLALSGAPAEVGVRGVLRIAGDT